MTNGLRPGAAHRTTLIGASPTCTCTCPQCGQVANHRCVSSSEPTAYTLSSEDTTGRPADRSSRTTASTGMAGCRVVSGCAMTRLLAVRREPPVCGEPGGQNQGGGAAVTGPVD